MQQQDVALYRKVSGRPPLRVGVLLDAFDESGGPTAPKPALEDEGHLFKWRGKVWLMPECGERNAVRIYEARRFPHDWTLHFEVRFGCPVHDPTLVERQGRWYLYAAVDECGGGADDELFLFAAQSPLGPWRPHALNPIVSDVRKARPAGRPFVADGRLIRPAQDCSGAYGGAIAFCEVDALSETEYSERVVGRLEPTWRRGLTGCHTFNAAGGCEVIDARREVSRFA